MSLESHGSFAGERISERPEVLLEAETRDQRLALMREFVAVLFPEEKQAELRDRIERSLHVPQWGEYHTEGIFMDRHFSGILAALNRLDNGEFPEEIPAEERAEIQAVVHRYREELHKYVFLHDISKADTFRVEALPQPGEKKGVIWEGTLEQFYDELRIPLEARQNPVAMARELEDMGVKKTSYMNDQASHPFFGRTTEKAKHGSVGKQVLEEFATSGMSDDVLQAIEHHEVAFQFETGKVDTYQKYFEPLSSEGRRLALVASLIDTMGSLRQNGKPEFRNILALLAAKHNYELWRGAKDFSEDQMVAGRKLDTRKLELFLRTIRKTETYIHESLGQVKARLLEECTMKGYDLERVRNALAQAIEERVLSDAEAKLIEDAVIAGDVNNLGQKLGRKMVVVNALLKTCEE